MDRRAILDEAELVLSAHLTPSGTSLHAYIHFEPSQPVEELLRLGNRRGILLKTPLEYTRGGALRMAAVGDLEDPSPANGNLSA